MKIVYRILLVCALTGTAARANEPNPVRVRLQYYEDLSLNLKLYAEENPKPSEKEFRKFLEPWIGKAKRAKLPTETLSFLNKTAESPKLHMLREFAEWGTIVEGKYAEAKRDKAAHPESVIQYLHWLKNFPEEYENEGKRRAEEIKRSAEKKSSSELDRDLERFYIYVCYLAELSEATKLVQLARKSDVKEFNEIKWRSERRYSPGYDAFVQQLSPQRREFLSKQELSDQAKLENKFSTLNEATHSYNNVRLYREQNEKLTYESPARRRVRIMEQYQQQRRFIEGTDRPEYSLPIE